MNPDGTMTLSQGGKGHKVAGTAERPIIDLCGKWVTTFMDDHSHFEVTVDGTDLHIRPINSGTRHDNSPTTNREEISPSADDLASIDRMVNSLVASTKDARQPGDSHRAGRFRSGWKDTTERNKDDYTSSALSKITWQNLGYRLANALGARSDEWINAVYEHIAAAWDAKYFAPTIDTQELEEQVDALREFHPLGAPPKGNKRPAKRRVADSEAIERDAEVKRWVLDKADGQCELCRMPSPYRSRAKGNPWYLEVHHVVPLKQNGPDTVCNAVALCPNCHTRCHQSIEVEEATQELYEGVSRLVKPE